MIRIIFEKKNILGFSIISWHQDNQGTSSLMEDKDLFIISIQYHGSSYPGHTRSKRISSPGKIRPHHLQGWNFIALEWLNFTVV